MPVNIYNNTEVLVSSLKAHLVTVSAPGLRTLLQSLKFKPSLYLFLLSKPFIISFWFTPVLHQLSTFYLYRPIAFETTSKSKEAWAGLTFYRILGLLLVSTESIRFEGLILIFNRLTVNNLFPKYSVLFISCHTKPKLLTKISNNVSFIV